MEESIDVRHECLNRRGFDLMKTNPFTNSPSKSKGKSFSTNIDSVEKKLQLLSNGEDFKKRIEQSKTTKDIITKEVALNSLQKQITVLLIQKSEKSPRKERLLSVHTSTKQISPQMSLRSESHVASEKIQREFLGVSDTDRIMKSFLNDL